MDTIFFMEPSPNERVTLLAPLRLGRSLVREAGRRIADDIVAGRLPPGARLPTEQALMATLGVSRTVIREAVAALRAEGLVATRQGIGSFVAEPSAQHLFRIEPGQWESLGDALHIMELRTAVETEAAGLAAERATRVQKRAIRVALTAIDAAMTRGEAAIGEDFAFHAAITDATGNPRFRQFLDFLGRFIIPRASVRIRALDMRTYLMTFQEEHRAIAQAIESGAVDAARDAMRAHLVMSQKRYRTLAPDGPG